MDWIVVKLKLFNKVNIFSTPELDKKGLLLLLCGLFFQDKQLWSNSS